MASFDHKKIEKRWQKEWEKKKLYKTADSEKGSDNYYALIEFPYPSGNLHTGHWYAFAVPDILARKKRMEGKNILFPIGFDAFGLPAENAAIKRGLNPKKWTYENIDYMKKQLKSMGASFDWSREVITADPEYYKWTQCIFLQFFKKGLAYRAETAVNWCPKDKTVLANEQVVGGHCERCGSEIVQKNMKQWMLRITDYAEKLLSGLDKLNWKEEIKEAQRNWIGKSEGAEIEFEIQLGGPTAKGRTDLQKSRIKVFTTRPDTLFGATYMVLAPEHQLISNLQFSISNYAEVKDYIEKAKRKTPLQRQQETKEKTGIELKGIKAINPATKEEISVWIADYVLGGYGTGAIMAVPAHDERDFEFASKFNLTVKHVVIPSVVDHVNPPRADKPSKTRINVHALVYDPVKKKYLIIRNKKFGWDTVVIGGVEEGEEPVGAALRELLEETGYVDLEFKRILGGPAKAAYFAKHKDENRIAITTAVYFELKSDKHVAIAEDGENEGNEILWIDAKDFVPGKMVNSELPYWLERLKAGKDFAYSGSGALINSGKFDGTDSESAGKAITEFVGGEIKTQYKLRDWVISRQRYWGVPIPIIHCPKCGVVAAADKDLPIKLPEIKDYLPTGEGKSPLAKAEKWLKVKCPKCGNNAERETDTLDTFVDSSWYFLRYTDPKNKKTFADAKKMSAWMPVDLYSGGAEHTTMHLLYSRFWYKAMFDLGLLGGSTAKLGDEPYKERRNRGIILGPDGQKMSKSKGNVIDPDEYVAKFGSDTVRMYLAFIGPYNEAGSYPWDPHGILGIRRFLDRVWNIASTKNLTKAQALQDLAQRDGASRAILQQENMRVLEKPGAETLARALNKTIKQVSENIEDFKFNTAISAMMIFLNEMEKNPVDRDLFQKFLRILAPFAPHLTEEIWNKLRKSAQGRPASGWKSIHLEPWPEFDPKMLEEDNFDLIVQINGKTRDKFSAPINISQSEAERLTLAREKVKLALENKQPRKIIFVPKRLINIVV
ncbi:leucine--tRNA ligase [Candidatus Giovannonibacteria bacterium RIFCSPHIGHO2_01_FULL_45_33]|uniref:Leucine--tRNA ligase n=1 Tax=Candidatus Giovannonibacteria bacterium RIFCSPLOWO2_01_FULL_45_34 TaxID=1798351 RepID=A0A1F5WZA2_9BACT|nr:MAG: leucine--tRNA ligase [Candidatus Giovannonibacteria bacterium RIFCSPHIGHO2_01_FULL_45_33]OGF80641.1 MAG: leucine--tRNA ligase [Candidatus Giovannonibacteria bacterium RIFCSPLOWO2_01_FULL_45_34]